jgi:hypothetical protein
MIDNEIADWMERLQEQFDRACEMAERAMQGWERERRAMQGWECERDAVRDLIEELCGDLAAGRREILSLRRQLESVSPAQRGSESGPAK